MVHSTRFNYKAKYLAALERARIPLGPVVDDHQPYLDEIERLKTKINWIAQCCTMTAVEANRLADVANDAQDVGNLSFARMDHASPEGAPWETSMQQVMSIIVRAKDRIGMLSAAYDDEFKKVKANPAGRAKLLAETKALNKLFPITGPVRPLDNDGWTDLKVRERRVRFEEMTPIDGLPRYNAQLEGNESENAPAMQHEPRRREPASDRGAKGRSLSDSRADERIAEATEALKEYAAHCAAEGRRGEARGPRRGPEHSRGQQSEALLDNRQTTLMGTLARPIKRHLPKRSRELLEYPPDLPRSPQPPARGRLPRASMESIPRFAPSQAARPPAPDALHIPRPVQRNNKEPAPIDEEDLFDPLP